MRLNVIKEKIQGSLNALHTYAQSFPYNQQ